MTSLFGGGNNNAQLQQQIAQQQAAAQDEQGQQMRILTASQAKADEETAGMNKPGLGRAMLTYNRNTGGAGTLGGQ